MAQHKWHKEIKEWADGAVIQYKDSLDKNHDWEDCPNNDPAWKELNQYRIKPQPKEPQYLYVYLDDVLELSMIPLDNDDLEYIGKIKLEEETNGR